MASTPLCEAPLAALKKLLRDEFPDVKSSHLSEALAYCLGFRTYASMQAALVGAEPDRPFHILNSDRFCERLRQFGYPDDPEFDFELWPPIPEVISTMPPSAYDIEYKTDRQKAWRNFIVCAVNAALAQKLFTLRPGDNRFVRPDGRDDQRLFDFLLPNGMPCRGYVADAGFDEVAVHAAVNPRGDWVRLSDAGFNAGDAFGLTWVERRNGAWMQSADTTFRCRRHLLADLAGLQVEPQGYGDRGKVIM